MWLQVMQEKVKVSRVVTKMAEKNKNWSDLNIPKGFFFFKTTLYLLYRLAKPNISIMVPFNVRWAAIKYTDLKPPKLSN